MRVPLRWLPFSLVLLLVVGAERVSARPFEVPTFPIEPASEVAGLRVAVGTDGTMVYVWQAGGGIWSQHFSQAGAALASPVSITVDGAQQRLAADTRGGYVVAFTRDTAGHRHLFGRRLDAAGQPVGSELAVDQIADDDAVMPEVLGLPAGSAFVWQQGDNCWMRRYDPDGVALADAFNVGDNAGGHLLVAAALDDGGVVVVWHDPSVHTSLGRTFNGDGSLRAGPQYLASLALDIQAVAATPSGGFVVAGSNFDSRLRLIEYDPSLSIVRQTDVEVLPASDMPTPELARDAAGRWLLVFATARYNANHTQLLGYLAPRARPLAADLTPLEPSFELSASAVPRVSAALLPSGSFVTSWSTSGAPGAARGYSNVVSLCTPDVHTCGDGVFDPRCEECDLGAGNDDDAPDTCRTTCLLPSCGDGTQDSGEVCDDGTATPCDGCDATCQPVLGLACGDAVLVPGCTDQCDDGNAIVGDGCAPGCTFERVPGGGSKTTDCFTEWIVDNPSNVPLLDSKQRFRRIQSCVDDDATCDFDGGTAGSCTFHVQVCGANTDVPGCVAPSALVSWDLTKPSSKQATARPELAAVRAAFSGVPGAITGISAADVCSPTLAVVVPLRGVSPLFKTGKVTLGATGTSLTGTRDKDTLQLKCVPH